MFKEHAYVDGLCRALIGQNSRAERCTPTAEMVDVNLTEPIEDAPPVLAPKADSST